MSVALDDPYASVVRDALKGRARPRIEVVQMVGDAWREQLACGENGPYAIVGNAVIVLDNDPALIGMVAYDEFAHRLVMTRPPPIAHAAAAPLPGPYPRKISDADLTLIQGYIQRIQRLRIGEVVARQAIATVGETRRIHPVRDWLNGLVWDGVPRLHHWLTDAFGAPDDPYHAGVGTKVLVAAVRRIRLPGVKFDHVLVLEGPQGAGKSRACRELFSADWFTDDLAHDLASKDAQQGMAGKWGIELAELNVLIKSTNQAAKAFFSRQMDYFRPPYGRDFVERPRQCVFVGTTNEFDYLTDASGNRRYWPVRCEKAEVGWITDNREQLWAEAVRADDDDEPLWLDTGLLQTKARAHQAKRTTEDVWTGKTREWLRTTARKHARIPDILEDCLKITSDKQEKRHEMRVATILRGEGWMSHRHRGDDGRPIVAWFAPGEELPGRPGITVPTVTTSEEDFV